MFVADAITKGATGDRNAFDAGEEVAPDPDMEAAADFRPDNGKLAEFDADGDLVRIFDDEGRLKAPWGVALAPEDFGPLSGALLVGNFGGTGRVLAFEPDTGKFIDYLRLEDAGGAGYRASWY